MRSLPLLLALLAVSCQQSPQPVPPAPRNAPLVREVPPDVIIPVIPPDVDAAPVPHAPDTVIAVLPTGRDIPARAFKYQSTLTRNARMVWGINAPVAMLGAQVEQESGWNEQAKSSAGAQGLGQFMPSTADWIDDAYPDLGAAQPFNPDWALRALIQYDKHLFDRIEGATDCDRHAFALSAYNGGLKWVQRDQALATASKRDANRYWGEVEIFNSGRTAAAWVENRGYPKRIIQVLQPKYLAWGKAACA